MQSGQEETPVVARDTATDERRRVLNVAIETFASRGYYGTTTDQIAHAAGKAQSGLLRRFRSKEQLFLEVLDEALGQLLSSFRTAVAATSTTGASGTVTRLASSIQEHEVLARLLLRGCVLGSELAIGPAVRNGLVEIYRFLRDDAGLGPEAAARLIGDMTALAIFPHNPGATTLGSMSDPVPPGS